MRKMIEQNAIALVNATLALNIQMALANPTADVSSGFQSLSDRQFAQRKWAVQVVLNAKLLLLTAGDDPGPRWHTLRCRDVATREPHAVLG